MYYYNMKARFVMFFCT